MILNNEKLIQNNVTEQINLSTGTEFLWQKIPILSDEIKENTGTKTIEMKWNKKTYGKNNVNEIMSHRYKHRYNKYQIYEFLFLFWHKLIYPVNKDKSSHSLIIIR